MSLAWVAATLLLRAYTWAILLVPSDSLAEEEFDALGAFKMAVKEDPSGCLSSWDSSHSDPCGWFGVSCSISQDLVVRLKLFNCSLRGTLSPRIGSLAYLQELILRGNLFSGAVPEEFGSLKALDTLDLSNNNLSGIIPPEIGSLASISKIYLSNNQFTGSLPPELGNLTRLEELRLDGNKLTGEIPAHDFSHHSHDSNNINVTGICLLSPLKVGDFSFNFFTGNIPSCLRYLSSSSFRGNCFLDRSALLPREHKECEMHASQSSVSSDVQNLTDDRKNIHKHSGPRQPHWLLILEIVTGAVLVVFMVICLVATFRRRFQGFSLAPPEAKLAKSRDDMLFTDSDVLKHIKQFSCQELEVACEDFSNIIGSTCSNVYKGTMKDGTEIAVISLCASEEDWTSYHELHFQHEVTNLARLNHENVAKFLGYCEEQKPFSRMFVFEYEPNGSLFEHLHYTGECQLSWSRRMRIVIGVALGLRHMHTELWPSFALANLHSSTVYLTEEFSPKLVDFDRWRVVLPVSEKSRFITSQVALNGHQESLKGKHIDVQANTFSFGVLLLEIISGRLSFCKDKGCLVDWAADYLENHDVIHNLVDPQLRYFNHNQLQTICSVVSLCLQPDPLKRPTMEILSNMLESGIDISVSEALKESPLAWAELALSP